MTAPHTAQVPRKREVQHKRRTCEDCGAPERVSPIGYTSIGLMGYCATCINRAFTAITKENRG